ncbi:MAG TPA: carboxypeptidase-like regulatory domain-containing protein, partial [Vicinamibacterales bacterium]
MAKRHALVAILLMSAASLAAFPAAADAQTNTSAIAGVVKDPSGAVLPGVTVEAASPALIERVRDVVTDGQGLYKIVDLPPGAYSVTFTLAGFSTFKHDAIDVPSGFSATVNATLQVGSLAQTVTVSGGAPVVDVQSNQDQKQLDSTVLTSAPVQRNPNSFAPLIPGVVGNLGQVGVFGGTFTVHGSNIASTSLAIDGFDTNSMAANGAGFIYYLNMSTIDQSTVTLSGQPAEYQKSGVRQNVIAKSGGNQYSATMYIGGGNHSLQSNNLTPQLAAQGLSHVNSLDSLFDANPGFGGPIKKDKLWFYLALRYDEEKDYLAGLYFNATPTAWTYTADTSRPATNYVWDKSANLHLTWQATPKNKFSGIVDIAPHCTCNRGFSATTSPEATQIGIFWPNYFAEGVWTYIPTKKIVIEAGIGSSWGSFQYNPQDGVTPNTIAVVEQSTGLSYRANSTYGQSPTNPVTYRASTTYVNGAHDIKFGFSDIRGQSIATNMTNQSMTYRFLNGVPNQVTAFDSPNVTVENMNADLGVYAQDRWTIKRLTLNYGLRYDYFNGSVPAQNEAALLQQFGLPTPTLLPVVSYAGVKNTPDWKDLNPRIAGVYDLFGDGKTAIRASLGRYVEAQTVTIATALNPITTSITSASRTWTDANGNYLPDSNLTAAAANGECGAISNVNFGLNNPNATKYATDVTQGYGKRPYSWEGVAGVQRELWSRAQVAFNYYYRSFSNFSVTENTATSATDYSTYCVTAPVDPRLPGGGGNQICGYYDVNPNKFGQVLSLITQASDFGKQQSVWNGYGLTTSVRLPRGGIVQGGVDQGR